LNRYWRAAISKARRSRALSSPTVFADEICLRKLIADG
jgi:hypothetical protein